MPNRIPSFRVAAPVETFLQQLGPLAELPGNWRGRGFNLIARPDFQGGSELFLELNPTAEELHFSSIDGPIPNRGAVQDNIELFGLHYLPQIRDRSNGGGIHLAPGLWLSVRPTTERVGTPTVVRMATIPHGTAVLIQGFRSRYPAAQDRARQYGAVQDRAPPRRRARRTVSAVQPQRPEYLPDHPTPTSITQAMVTDPSCVRVSDRACQTITATVVLEIATTGGTVPNAFGGAEDIPFLKPNADVAEVSAIFWIEKVKYPAPYDDHLFLQLQYTQTVILNFDGLSWPHVSVATLRKVT
jgi:hypothetical protein